MYYKTFSQGKKIQNYNCGKYTKYLPCYKVKLTFYSCSLQKNKIKDS